MTHLIVDGAMLTILSQVKGLVEIQDPNGRVIGFFAPTSMQKARLYAQAAARIDPAEIERRKRTPPEDCIPNEEVLASLKALEEESNRRKAAGAPDLTPDEAVEFVRARRKNRR